MRNPEKPEVEPLDTAVDHVRGAGAQLILMYGDYECPYSRQAYRDIQRVERELDGDLRFAFRHFPLTEIHPHALAASQAAEAVARQGRYWEMHDILYSHQRALDDHDLRGYAAELDVELDRFDSDLESDEVLERIRRDVRSGTASGEVMGTPTLFINGALHSGRYDSRTLLSALAEDNPR